MRALDLFCKAGGASAGLAEHFNEVVGVDVEFQPRYPHAFVHADVFNLDTDWVAEFDFVWASPPCQFATAYKRRKQHVRESPNLIPRTRGMLENLGVPFVVENVEGARGELREPVRLCGSSFGLDVRRHRLFEAHGFSIEEVECCHETQLPRFPPATNRKNPRRTVEIGVWRIPIETQYAAMGGCEWMNLSELSNAVPPAYSSFIAECFLK